MVCSQTTQVRFLNCENSLLGSRSGQEVESRNLGIEPLLNPVDVSHHRRKIVLQFKAFQSTLYKLWDGMRDPVSLMLLAAGASR